MQSTPPLPIIGMDIAKNVFQLHCVDPRTGEIERYQLRRGKITAFFAQREPSLVAMEACGSAHHWARVLLQLGHRVKLLPPAQVRPFVVRDKTDARDAQAIWVAAQQPHIKAVAVKSVQQQACLALHRMRSQLMKMRIMQTNALRGLLAEFGVALPKGHRCLLRELPQVLERAAELGLPEVLVVSVQEQLARIQHLQHDIDALQRRLQQVLRSNRQMQLVQSIPGIGALGATALVATAGDITTFSSARQFAAWLGLTPRQTGTGGKVRQLGLSKRGDTYVRTLLMHGARSIIVHGKYGPWLQRLLARRPYGVVVAALANKLARTAWALLRSGQPFEPRRWWPAAAPEMTPVAAAL